MRYKVIRLLITGTLLLVSCQGGDEIKRFDVPPEVEMYLSSATAGQSLGLIIIIVDADFTGKLIGTTTIIGGTRTEYDEVEPEVGGLESFQITIGDSVGHRITHQGIFGFYRPDIACGIANEPQQTFVKHIEFDLTGFDWKTLFVDIRVVDDENQSISGSTELLTLLSRPHHFIYISHDDIYTGSSSDPTPDCIAKYL